MKNIAMIPNDKSDEFEIELVDLDLIDSVTDCTVNNSQSCYEFELTSEENIYLEILINQFKIEKV